MNNAPKIVIIGLDGGKFNIINEMEDSRLPNLKKLIREGSYGILKSTVPALTAPAWTTFRTGKNPRKDGMYGF